MDSISSASTTGVQASLTPFVPSITPVASLLVCQDSCQGLDLLANGPRGYVDHSLQTSSCSDPLEQTSSTVLETAKNTDADSSKSTELSECGEDTMSDPDVTPSCAASRALFLVDWDDTLFPTTWVQTSGLMTAACNESQVTDLGTLATSVQSTLAAAARHNGKVIIVTNADAGWVELSMNHFMPSLTPQLAQLEVDVVSARALHEHTGVTCPFEWKRRTFRDVCDNFYCSGEARNLICLGDSMHEHTALANVVADMPNTVTKNIKFAIRPNVSYLIHQHATLALSFDDIVANGRSLRVDL